MALLIVFANRLINGAKGWRRNMESVQTCMKAFFKCSEFGTGNS